MRSSQSWSHQGQSTSSSTAALPLWQEQALTQLQLLGPSANLEVTLGGDPQCIDPRLLAAVRILYCQDPSELREGSLAQLGAWGVPLNAANEVRQPSSIYMRSCLWCGLAAQSHHLYPRAHTARTPRSGARSPQQRYWHGHFNLPALGRCIYAFSFGSS